MNPKAKIKILEFFYAIDHLYFGKNLKKIKTCCPLLKEDFLITKGAFLTTVVEIAKLVKYEPKIRSYISRVRSGETPEKIVKENSKMLANRARKNSINLLKDKRSIKIIKNETVEILKENSASVTSAVQQSLRKRAFELALDNLVLASIFSEGHRIRRMDKFIGRTLEGAYNILKEALVERAMTIIENMET